MNDKYIKHLPAKTAGKQINPKQTTLDLAVAKATEIQGIGMGVLSDGTPFLTQRGLASICGVQNAYIGTISSEWGDAQQKPRISKIKDILKERGVTVASPHIEVKQGDKVLYAYSDTVCLAILEYYAFEAGPNFKDQALKNFRALAGRALQDFIYAQVGYDPKSAIPNVWRHFHDRVSLVYDAVPHGYFSIFKEIADIVVTMIQMGAMIDSHFVPDISVGNQWAKHWKELGLEKVCGPRKNYPHNYPDYFPQAKSNPQPAYCYPDAALPEFRRWFRMEYLTKHFKNYLESKQREGALPPSFVQLAIEAISPKQITP